MFFVFKKLFVLWIYPALLERYDCFWMLIHSLTDICEQKHVILAFRTIFGRVRCLISSFHCVLDCFIFKTYRQNVLCFCYLFIASLKDSPAFLYVWTQFGELLDQHMLINLMYFISTLLRKRLTLQWLIDETFHIKISLILPAKKNINTENFDGFFLVQSICSFYPDQMNNFVG